MSAGGTNDEIWFADAKQSEDTLILASPEDLIRIQVTSKASLERGTTFSVRVDRKERTIEEGGRE
jgi:hypothetical protein